jgi:CO/xanthine dehydrogenase Mo-binding subunit
MQMDRIAREIGADPWELRLRNAYRNGDERPYRKTVEDATLIETIQAAAELVGHDLPSHLKELRS